MTTEEARLQAIEARALAVELILTALIGSSDRRSMILDAIERDVADWDQRGTPAAQSELAEAAREQVHLMLQGLREMSKPRQSH
jgi:hypothetical protein